MPWRLLFALPRWGARRDTASLSLFAWRVDSAQRVTTQALRKEIEQYGVRSAGAYTALAGAELAVYVEQARQGLTRLTSEP